MKLLFVLKKTLPLRDFLVGLHARVIGSRMVAQLKLRPFKTRPDVRHR
jgi:hypothetical protein